MKKEELELQIRYIGHSCYVNCYDIFKNYANCNITKIECLDLILMKIEANSQELSEKCEIAKDIFQNNMQSIALELIYKKVKDKDTKEKIENILGFMAQYA